LDLSLLAPDQPSPEALPLAEEPEPLPVIETQSDYPPGVQRMAAIVPVERRATHAQARPQSAAAARRKKRKLPSDWQAKKRMLLLCLLLLIANIGVGAYLVFTWNKRKPRRPDVPILPLPKEPARKVVPPPPGPIDVGQISR